MIEEENKVTTDTLTGIENNSNEEVDTTTGLIAYLTLIGFVIALVLNNEKKGATRSFGAFHLRQSLGLMFTAIAISIGLAILSVILMVIFFGSAIIMSIIWPLFSLGILVLLIIGVINAVNGQKKELPIIGSFITKTLGKAFE